MIIGLGVNIWVRLCCMDVPPISWFLFPLWILREPYGCCVQRESLQMFVAGLQTPGGGERLGEDSLCEP